MGKRVTIQELIVSDGRWPSIRGPRLPWRTSAINGGWGKVFFGGHEVGTVDSFDLNFSNFTETGRSYSLPSTPVSFTGHAERFAIPEDD